MIEGTSAYNHGGYETSWMKSLDVVSNIMFWVGWGGGELGEGGGGMQNR